MYALLSRIDDGLEPLRKKFEEHVKTSGLHAVKKVLGEGGVDALVGHFLMGFEHHGIKRSLHACASQEPKTYVDALLEVHKKNADTVNRSFKGEAGFVGSLDRVRTTPNTWSNHLF
jgi:cullin 1